MLKAIDFTLLERLCIVRRILERRQQFSQRHRPTFITADPLVEQIGQKVICVAVENGLREKERFVVVFALPPKAMVVVPDLFLNGLDFLKEDGGLVMQHFPRQANQTTAGRQVEVFTVLDALSKHRKEGREVNIPRIERFLAYQREHQRNRTVKRVMQALMFRFFRRSDGGDSLAELLSIFLILTLTEKLVDDLLLEEPSVQHALFLCHDTTSLFVRFHQGFVLGHFF